MNTEPSALEAIDRANSLREAADLLILLLHQELDDDRERLDSDTLSRVAFSAHELLVMAAA